MSPAPTEPFSVSLVQPGGSPGAPVPSVPLRLRLECAEVFIFGEVQPGGLLPRLDAMLTFAEIELGAPGLNTRLEALEKWIQAELP